MQWFNDLRLRAKLLFSFGLITALLGVVGYVGIQNLNDIRAATRNLVYVEAASVQASMRLMIDLRTAQRDLRQAVLTADDAQKDTSAWEASLQESVSGIDRGISELETLLYRPEGKAKLASVREAVGKWSITRDKIADHSRNKRAVEAAEAFESPENAAGAAAISKAVDDLVDYKTARSAEVADETDAAASKATNIMLGLIALAVSVSVVIAFYLSRRLSASMLSSTQRLKSLSAICLTNLQRGMEAMIRGDLSIEVTPATQPLVVESKDEFGELAETFNAGLAQTKATIEAYTKARGILQGVMGESGRLVEAGRSGELDIRGDAKRFEGVFQALVQGMNDLLEAVVLPMNEASDVLQGMARGDLTTEMRGEYAGDHDRLKVALNSAIQEMQRTIGLISTNAQTLASSAEELSAVATQMGGNAEETSAQAEVVSQASSQVSKSVQTVAVGTEEMSSSIRDIAKNASEAARVASQAVSAADETNTIVTKLGTSSQEIGQVIKVITSIAQQTNLLALNATIEAARAGEAGKGFAVVANEVKELAKQTAGATEDISRRIEAIRGDTQQAVEAIRNIGGVISQINDIQIAIASAVEEQTATTNEMGRNAAEAARGSQDIASNIVGVAKAAEQTSSGAQNSQQAAQELARMAAELQQLVGKFQYEAGSRHDGAQPRAANGRGRPAPRRAA